MGTNIIFGKIRVIIILDTFGPRNNYLYYTKTESLFYYEMHERTDSTDLISVSFLVC